MHKCARALRSVLGCARVAALLCGPRETVHGEMQLNRLEQAWPDVDVATAESCFGG